jgi:hypothetical protein
MTSIGESSDYLLVIASQRDRAKSRVPVTSSQSNSARSRTHRGFEIFFVDGGA